MQNIKDKLFSRLIIFVSIISTCCSAYANLRDDMKNNEMTLIEITRAAYRRSGDIKQVVLDMIEIEPEQSTAIIAAALETDPDSLDQIIEMAIDADVRSWETAGAAILALGAEDELSTVKYVTEITIALDPDNSRRIIETAARVSEFDFETIAGIEKSGRTQPSRYAAVSSRGTSASDEMEEVPGPKEVEIVDLRSTLNPGYMERTRLRSLKSPR